MITEAQRELVRHHLLAAAHTAKQPTQPRSKGHWNQSTWDNSAEFGESWEAKTFDDVFDDVFGNAVLDGIFRQLTGGLFRFEPNAEDRVRLRVEPEGEEEEDGQLVYEPPLVAMVRELISQVERGTIFFDREGHDLTRMVAYRNLRAAVLGPSAPIPATSSAPTGLSAKPVPMRTETHITAVPANSEELQDLLRNGWQPFGVTRQRWFDTSNKKKLTIYHLFKTVTSVSLDTEDPIS